MYLSAFNNQEHFNHFAAVRGGGLTPDAIGSELIHSNIVVVKVISMQLTIAT